MRTIGDNLAKTISAIKDKSESFSISPISYNGGWQEIREPVVWTSATRITVANVLVDLSKSFAVGDKIRLKQVSGVYKYFYVTLVAANYLDITGGSDYTLLNEIVDDLAKGVTSSPIGHPVLLKYAPLLTAIGATYTAGSSDGLNYRFLMIGKQVLLSMYDLGGSSVNGACVLQFNLPIPAFQIESGFIRLLNITSTVALAYVSNISVTPTNPQLYGVIFKDVTELALANGSANHQGTIFYTALG